VISQEYLTVAECAAVLKVGRDSVIRWFGNRTGVLKIGNPESRFGRKYVTLRIPKEVLEEFIVEVSA